MDWLQAPLFQVLTPSHLGSDRFDEWIEARQLDLIARVLIA
jgi:hypothetical protein